MNAPIPPKSPISLSPPLQDGMTCEVAFRTMAMHYLHQLTARHLAALAGGLDAVHAMRVALTRLRTSILFFAPMLAGAEQVQLIAELKWLNAHLGMVRDLDVALERLAKSKKRQTKVRKTWIQERTACHRLLARALRSARYRRLIGDVTAWVAQGDWTRSSHSKDREQRAQPVTSYSTRKLKDWRKKLLKKSRKLEDVGAKKRHRLRLINKRMSYATESVTYLIPAAEVAIQKATLKLLRKAQRSLGRLNDDERFHSLVATLGESKATGGGLLLGLRQKKRLLRRAASAYDELSELEPLRISNPQLPLRLLDDDTGH
ncbi:MAG TPA: CHAD domain-containing protein [Bradyrhizobium sp.]|nr:CHAD domain-containing protein [Bradyrhizobium sp.]